MRHKVQVKHQTLKFERGWWGGGGGGWRGGGEEMHLSRPLLSNMFVVETCLCSFG